MAVDMFLKLDGIKGESQDFKHAGEIEILSFSWGMSQAGAFGTGGGGAGKVSVHDISITKRLDGATAQLLKSCATGEHIPSGLITVRKAGEKPVEYLKIKLVDILVSSLQVSGNSAGTPSDFVTLDFKKMSFTAYAQSSTGQLTPYTAEISNNEQGQPEAPPPAPPA